MSNTLEAFGHFHIARRANGEPVEFQRSPKEVVFLAFDSKIKRLVELHLLKSGEAMDATEKRSALDRAKLATQVRGPSFMRIFEAGEDENVTYFAGNLNDGEFAEDYVQRRGAVPAVTVFCLVQQLLEDLVELQSYSRLVSRMSLANPLVTTLEDTFLQLRVVDYGLSDKEQVDGEQGMRRLVAECCGLLFLLLTGQPYEGQNPDRFPAMTCLPTNLRTHLRASLADPGNASLSLEKLRDDVKEAYATLVSSIQVRTSRKHLVVTDSLQPLSKLQDLLMENVPVTELLKGRFTVHSGDEVRRYPFTIPALNAKTEQPVTVHLLPPSRIVDKSQYEAVPLQMWRFNAERHPNVLRSLSLWENPDWTFLTEEREPGFALSRLMAERLTLNPPEVLVLLRQVRAGLDQLIECGVASADLHPSNLLLRVGKGGTMQAREFERLMQKRIDAWPPFLLKLRAHATMRSLYEPLIVEGGEDDAGASDCRNRTFITLAIYLLTGERQSGGVPKFGEMVSEPLAAYLGEAVAACRKQGRAPSPGEFLEGFEKHMAVPDSVGRGIAAIMGAERVAKDDMESVGSVSDFDNEFSDTSDGPDHLLPAGPKLLGTASTRERKELPRGSIGALIWVAVALMIGVFAYWLLSAVKGESPEPMASTQGSTSTESVHSQESAGTGAHIPSTEPDANGHPVQTKILVSPSELKGGTPAPPVVEIKKAIIPTPKEALELKNSYPRKL
jgi:hypothetical protein